MSSYYDVHKGTLEVAQLAQSSDIMTIQSHVQDAIKSLIVDMFGPGYILESTEDALKLTATPIHSDQQNLNYDSDNSWISFYERYFRQGIHIEKSAIETIKVQMINNSKFTVMVHAEILDDDLTSKGISSVQLEPTTDENEYTNVNFDFNIDHLPLGDYYFVLKPVDISNVELTKSNNETITPDDFKIRYDRGGNYTEGLEVSYNGIDYLEARRLEDQYDDIEDAMVVMHDTNFDLYFDHVFSSGNTYLISGGTAVVNGEKVYPMDTHVSIGGPSTLGNRIDLVYLDEGGKLNVKEGNIFPDDKPTDEHYPTTDSGLKIAYITTYQTSVTQWTCGECGHINDGNIGICEECGNIIGSTQIPLVEQNDDDGITRQRDVMERLRRLENKMDYHAEYNTPTRVKWTCVVDPIIEKADPNDAEGTYGMSASTNSNGETVIGPDSDVKSVDKKWSLIQRTYHADTKVTKPQNATLTTWDLHISATKPKKLTTDDYFAASIASKANNKLGISGLSVKLTLKKGKKTYTSVTKKTNSKGMVYLNIYGIKGIKAGSYTMYTTYGSTTLKNTIKVDSKSNFKKTSPAKKTANISVSTDVTKNKKYTVSNDVIAGNDAFTTDNINIEDKETGEAYIKKLNNKTDKAVSMNKYSDIKKFYDTSIKYKITNNTHQLDSQYPVLNFHLENDCDIESITPYVTKFYNIKDFKVIIFKNNGIFNSKKSKRISYKKKLSGDTTFPNVISTEYISIAKNSTKKGKLRTLKKPHTFKFKTRKTLTAGDYSLLLLCRLNKGASEGYVQIKEYHTLNHKDEYGTSTKCIGTAKPSVIYLETNNITSRSWFVDIKKVDHEFNSTGTLISKVQTTDYNISSCKFYRNISIPSGSGCSITFYVSNNGGKTYVTVPNKNGASVKFTSTGNSFRWRAVFKSDGTKTPKIYFNSTKGYAVYAKLNTAANVPEYEDYSRCYETPLINANTITKTNVAYNNLAIGHFSEWEFARLFLEDTDAENATDESRTKIDILFSYAPDEVNTNWNTPKDSWDKRIFFSQVFADLMLKDFSRESVDYDNYEASVEPDEYNYRFKYQTDYSYNHAGEVLSTAQDVTNINYENVNFSNFRIDYAHAKDTVIYEGNEPEGANRYSGMSIKTGPYAIALYEPELEKTEQYYNKSDDTTYDTRTILVGVNFPNGLNITDNYTNMSISLIPQLQGEIEVTDESAEIGTVVDLDTNGYRKGIVQEKTVIENNVEKTIKVATPFVPAGALELVVSLNQYGLIEEDNATYGRAYVINKDLISGEHTTHTISIRDDVDSFNDIHSIGIRLRNPETVEDEALANQISHLFKATQQTLVVSSEEQAATSQEAVQEATGYKSDGIGMGIIKIGAYNIKPYLPYIYTGDTRRWNWKRAANAKTSTPNVLFKCTGKGSYYGMYDTIDKTTQIFKRSGTTFTATDDVNLKTTVYGNHITAGKYKSLSNGDGANEMAFDCNANEKGYLFYNNTNFTLDGYSLFEIRYYITNGGQIHKGDIIVELYDIEYNSTDIARATPVESFPLPAWGQVQHKSTQSSKVVHAIFKIRNTGKIKCVVIKRENPTEALTLPNLRLHIYDMRMINADSIPSLGPQMQIRIYPNQMTNLTNTKIRKFGVIYRLT